MRHALRRKSVNVRTCPPRHAHRPLFGEQLETRRVLAGMTDLEITDFTGNGQWLDIAYEVSGDPSAPFDIAIYRSSDGVTLEELVLSATVADAADLATGHHTRSLAADFASVVGNYKLIALLDAGDAVAEQNESNNAAALADAAFQSLDGDLHVHGTDGDDTIEIRQFVDMNMNHVVEVHVGSQWLVFDAASVGVIHVWAHDGNDRAEVFAGVNFATRVYGGAGNDTIFGGDADDRLYGGDGDDILTGRGGDDWLFGQLGDDIMSGGIGADTFLGGGGGGYDQNDFNPYDGDHVNEPPIVLSVHVNPNGPTGTIIYGSVWDDGPTDQVQILLWGSVEDTVWATATGEYYAEFWNHGSGQFFVQAVDMYGQVSEIVVGWIE